MRLLIATPLYPPEIGGPATDAAALTTRLRAEGHEVVVYPFCSVRHHPKIIRHILYSLGLFKRARTMNCIVAFDTVSVGVLAAVIAKLKQIPLIVRVPGDYAWEQGVQRFQVKDTIEIFQHARYGFFVEFLRRLQQFVTRSAALVVVPSDYFKDIVSTWGIKPDRLIRIYLGINLTEIAITTTSRPQGKVLFSVGRLVPWKGFDMILRLLVVCPEWQAVIAGDGPLHKILVEQARTLGVSDRVQFAGALPRSEVLGWCASADAFVLNTSFESFSFQVLEAMSVGAAIVTTRIGSLPELITDGVGGLLHTPNDLDAFKDALTSIVKEPELWERRRVAAKHAAGQFSIEKSAEIFTRELQKICA